MILALAITALIGMLGIALDGGRIYVDRRALQNAADAAALAAADAYAANLNAVGGSAPQCGSGDATQTAATADAYTAGVKQFANQLGVASGAYALNGPLQASYSTSNYKVTLDEEIPTASVDHASLKVACVFKASVSHGLWMAFIPVIGGTTSTTGACNGVTFPCNEVSVAAQAISAASIPIPNAWVFILDPSTSSGPFPCGNGTNNSSLTVGGTGTLTVAGTIISNGNITWNGNPNATLNNGGDMIDHCDAAAPYPSGDVTYNGGGTYMQSPTTFGDPFGPTGLNWVSAWWTPFKSSYTAADPSTTSSDVELKPGHYSQDFKTAGCWFLEPGQYEWDNGLLAHAHNGLASNELMPPGGEDATAAALSSETLFSWVDGNTSGSGVGSTGCIGKVAANVTAGSAGSSTTYYIRVASARKETVAAGTACTGGCWRESYYGGLNASACVAATMKTDGSVQVGISNVPGMGNVAGTSTTIAGVSTTYTPANRYDIYVSSVANACTSDNTVTDWHYASSATFDTTGAQAQSGIGSCPAMPATSATPDTYVTTGGCTLGGVISASIPASRLAAAVGGGVTACSLNTAVTDTVTLPISLLSTHTISGWSVGCTHPYQSNNANCQSPNGIDGTTNCYDVANEHYCLTSSGPGNYCNFFKPQKTYTTPGGVIFYIPQTAAKCIDTTSGAAQYYVYGTDALYDVVLYMPDNCANSSAQINGGGGGAFVGWGYAPGQGDDPKLSGNGDPFSGGLVTWDLVIEGTNGFNVPGGVPSFLFTTALGSKLLICTNTTPGCPAP